MSEGIKFHGHLGPYLVLGILAGEWAVKRLNCKRYFDVRVKVWGANKKPKSCLIDGLQLSTGATYGKGNIVKLNSHQVKIDFLNLRTNKKITLKFSNELIGKLKITKTHSESETLARKLYKTDCSQLFNLTFNP